MGGVDLADNMLANIRIRGKKWWWRIFSNYIDVCIVNAWKLWLDIHHQEKTSLLDFRRQTTVKLLKSACVPSAFALENSRPRSSTLLHFLKHIFCNKRHRCRQCHSQNAFSLWDVWRSSSLTLQCIVPQKLKIIQSRCVRNFT